MPLLSTNEEELNRIIITDERRLEHCLVAIFIRQSILDSLKRSLSHALTTKSFKSDGGDESDENDIQNERVEKSSQERSTRVPPRQKKKKCSRAALNLGFWS